MRAASADLAARIVSDWGAGGLFESDRDGDAPDGSIRAQACGYFIPWRHSLTADDAQLDVAPL
jgi:hypothetical protein